jgi:hypothetical protein
MTTIAWDGCTVVADCRCSWGNAYKDEDIKIVEEQGILFAGVGNKSLFVPMIGWYLAGCDVDTIPKILDQDCGLLVFRDKKCTMYKSTSPYPEEFTAPESWGSGSQYAMGAMQYGATATEAVIIAARCDSCTSAAKLTAFEFSDAITK